MTGTTPRGASPEVLVVGGGPAGSTVAGLLAARGFDVLIVDRCAFPRPKPCGECLNPGAVSALRSLDLLAPVRALGPAPICGWDLRTPGVRVRARFGPGVEPGLAIPRRALDAALLEAAVARGARLRTGVRVTGVTLARPGEGPWVRCRSSEGTFSLRPRLVVGADGLRSVVARSIGAIRRRPRVLKVSLTYHVRGPRDGRTGTLFFGDHGTVGLAPLGRAGDGWNATVVVSSERYGAWLARSREDLFRLMLGQLPVEWAHDAEIVGGPWASGPFDRPTEFATAPGVLLVGDAAGYYDPLTGQGIYRALRSAALAAAASEQLLSGAAGSRPTRRAYESAVRRLVGPGRRMQQMIEAIVSREGLRRRALGALAARPDLSARLIRVTGDAASFWTLGHPASWTRDAERSETDAYR